MTDPGVLLVHLLIVVVAARLAAELAERAGQPAVVFEILAGVLIGPSVLNLVGHNEVLIFFAEIGAILLLLQVGMEMNMRDLAKVGGSALRVAGIGIAGPMLAGYLLMTMTGMEPPVALFLAAGITATSVGITARVFGDLRMLASPEARTVLAAAVADDVGGLLILTVVLGVVSSGSVDIATVAGVMTLGIGFVVVGTLVGMLLAPRLFSRVAKSARTDGTLMASGLALALTYARLASAARLAPIVGAFIGGLALSQTEAREEIRRRLVPVGHLFIPIFFVQIGIDTEIRSFLQPQIWSLVGLLMVAAVAGKISAGWGVGRGGGDRLLVGISMVPRGEVGLIFAGLGLAGGILDEELYAVLVAVVLLTTIIPPPLIRRRAQKIRRRPARVTSEALEPEGGWLVAGDGGIDLVGDPPEFLAPRIGLEAAVICAYARPGIRLLDWLGSLSLEHTEWDDDVREHFYFLLAEGNERSWRFMEVTGLAAALLPSVEAAMHRRMRDPFQLDPAGVLRWDTLFELNQLVAESSDPAVRVWERLSNKELVRLGALARDAFAHESRPGEPARELARLIGLPADEQESVAFLVEDRNLLQAASARLTSTTERYVLELAVHLQLPERADALYVLAIAEDAMEVWERERMDALYLLVGEALSHPDLIGPNANSLIDQRRKDVVKALAHMPEDLVRRHIDAAPRRYLLAQTPATIARHVKMTDNLPGKTEIRLEAEPLDRNGMWTVHVAALDRRGLLAAIAGALASYGIAVQEASVSTWETGVAIDVFKLTAPADVDWEKVRALISSMLADGSTNGHPVPIEGLLRIDSESSPWYTIVEVQARDRQGLLYRVTSALAATGLEVSAATLATVGSTAVDIFHVTGADGSKLDEEGERRLRSAFAGRAALGWKQRLRKAAAKA